jgi:hypothetical protein
MTDVMCRACAANPVAIEGLCSPCHRDRIEAERAAASARELARISASQRGKPAWRPAVGDARGHGHGSDYKAAKQVGAGAMTMIERGATPARGHHDKIHAAVQKAQAKGLLRPHMRASERDAMVLMQLAADGWTGNRLPTRWSIRRYFERASQKQSHESHVA